MYLKYKSKYFQQKVFKILNTKYLIQKYFKY